LLLAYYDPDGRLIHAGRVGSGINQAELERLWRILRTRSVCTRPTTASTPKQITPSARSLPACASSYSLDDGWMEPAMRLARFWRISRHPAVQQALRNPYFDGLGLPRLYVPAQAARD
jgi:ATP-dependent DNA ligase